MAKCDLCGDSCSAHSLQQLLDSYQVDGVVDICPSCRAWANRTKGSLLDAIGPQMRDAIRARMASPRRFSILNRIHRAAAALGEKLG